MSWASTADTCAGDAPGRAGLGVSGVGPARFRTAETSPRAGDHGAALSLRQTEFRHGHLNLADCWATASALKTQAQRTGPGRASLTADAVRHIWAYAQGRTDRRLQRCERGRARHGRDLGAGEALCQRRTDEVEGGTMWRGRVPRRELSNPAASSVSRAAGTSTTATRQADGRTDRWPGRVRAVGGTRQWLPGVAKGTSDNRAAVEARSAVRTVAKGEAATRQSSTCHGMAWRRGWHARGKASASAGLTARAPLSRLPRGQPTLPTLGHGVGVCDCVCARRGSDK